MTYSEFVANKVAERAVIREAFEEYRAAAYLLAEDECRGALLNALGRRRGISSYSLFMGPTRNAYAYASAELVEYWRSIQRPMLESFSAQVVDSPTNYEYA